MKLLQGTYTSVYKYAYLYNSTITIFRNDTNRKCAEKANTLRDFVQNQATVRIS